MKRLILLVLVWPVLAFAGTWEGPEYVYCQEYWGDGRPNRLCSEEVYRQINGVSDFNATSDIFGGIREDDLPQKGWWWNPDQPGEGVFMEINPSQNGSTGYWLFGVVYSYDTDGNPEWYTFGGEYQHPEDATRWREKSKPFNRLFLHEQAPADFNMGEFHGTLYRSTGGTCLQCGTVAANTNAAFRDVSIEWADPYHATMTIGNRVMNLRPSSLFTGLDSDPGEFLTDGYWRIDQVRLWPLGTFRTRRPSEDRWPDMRAIVASSVVKFTEIEDMEYVWRNGSYDTSRLRDFAWYPGVRCWASNSIGSETTIKETHPDHPDPDGDTYLAGFANSINTSRGTNTFYMVCHYPHTDDLRLFDMYWRYQDKDLPPANEVYLYGFEWAAPAPRGDIRSFNFYPAGSLDERYKTDPDYWYAHPIRHFKTNHVQMKNMLTPEAFDRQGIHFTKLESGGKAARFAPTMAATRHSPADSRNYYSAQLMDKNNSYRFDDFDFDWYAELPLDLHTPKEDGFYSPVPKDDSRQQRVTDGWYWNPDQPGWGVSYTIFRMKDKDFIFGAVYTHDENGQPRWYTFSGDYVRGQDLETVARAYKNGTCIICTNYRPNQPDGTLPLKIHWQSETRATFTLNGHAFDMQRADFYKGTGSDDADFLLEDVWHVQGLRMEATRRTYFNWQPYKWGGTPKWENQSIDRKGIFVRPQAVFSDDFFRWQKMDLNNLSMASRNKIRDLAGASDNAVFYISDKKYDEKFLNYMRPEEYTENERNNRNFLDEVGFGTYPDFWPWRITWMHEVQDAGRFVLAYEPATREVTFMHLSGDAVLNYPHAMAPVEVLDEVVLFKGELGTAGDDSVVFNDVECPASKCAMTDPALRQVALKANWRERNHLFMSRVRTMDQELHDRMGYVEYCPFAAYRAEGKWQSDSRKRERDGNHLLQEGFVYAPHWSGVCAYYYPDPSLWTQEWFDWTESDYNPLDGPQWVPQYHIQ